MKTTFPCTEKSFLQHKKKMLQFFGSLAPMSSRFFFAILHMLGFLAL
jgi:hypothetical protein